MKTEKEIVEAYLEAINQHDIDAVMSLFAEDATFEIVDYLSKVGKQALRQQMEYEFTFNCKLKFSDYVFGPGQISFKITEQTEFLRTLGVDEFRFPSCIMTIYDGLITSVRAEFSQESKEQAEQVNEAFMAWAAKEKPETLAELMPGGEFIPGKESGLAMMALMREWKAEQA